MSHDEVSQDGVSQDGAGGSRMLALTIQVGRILTGYLLGALAGTVVAALLLADWQAATGPTAGRALMLAAALAPLVAALALPPAGLLIALAEWRGWRSAPVAVAGGAAIGLVTGLFDPEGGVPLHASAVGGASAGLIYWILAGRHAGALRRTG